MQTIVRRAVPADAAGIAAISVEVWLSTYIREGVSKVVAEYALGQFTPKRILRSIAERPIWVSENKSGIDGFAVVDAKAPAPARGCSSFEIKTLYVQPRHQSGGKGIALVNAALDHARASGFESVWLSVNAENRKAIAFYAKLGFEQVGTIDFKLGGGAHANPVLRRLL